MEQQSLACCDEIRSEVERVLTSKFKMLAHDAADLMTHYLNNTVHVTITGSLRNICRDRKDDMVVECALVSQAQFIVSGDKDLLSLGSFGEIKIISPKAFLALAQTAI